MPGPVLFDCEQDTLYLYICSHVMEVLNRVAWFLLH